MADKVKVELNLKGVNELMKSAPIQSALKAAGEAVAQQAGGGAHADSTRTINWIAVQDIRSDDEKDLNVLISAASSVGLSLRK